MTDTTTIKTEPDSDTGLLTVDTGPLGFDPFGEKHQDQEGTCVFCGRSCGQNPKTVMLDDRDHTVVVVRDEAGRAEANRIIDGDRCSGALQVGAWEVGSTCHKRLAATLARHGLSLL